ncbi:MAG: cation:proton antiporter regulatory subunit, partial [Bacteroidota bacterium]
NKILMLSEGIDIFSVTMPEKLVGRNLLDSQIRENTGCTVIALKRNGEVIANPNPANKFERDNTLLLLGTEEAEAKFMKMYS